MSPNRFGRGVAVLFATAIFFACSSNEAPGTAAAAGKPEARPVASNNRRDPCVLITPAEAEAILGVPVTMRRAEKDERTCEYAPSVGKKLNGFTVTVYWKGGKEALTTLKGGMSVATGMMKDGETDPTSMMKLEPVPGLGDEAYFNPIAGTSVLLDDTLLEFDITAMMWHQSREEGLTKWKKIAATALARL
jgi:hypothetical protein